MANSTTAKTAKPRKPAAAKAQPQPAAKERFAKAIDEAKAGAAAFAKEAQDQAGTYRAKAADTSSEWIDQAKVFGGEARDKAWELANDGKSRASEALTGLGSMVADNAAVLDEKVGAKYGDMARSAAKSMQDTATKIEQKDLGELTEDAKEFVRKNPGTTVAIAAAAGFLLSRLFNKSDD